MSLPEKPQFPGQVLEHYVLMDQHLKRFFPDKEVMVYEEIQSFGYRVDVFRVSPKGKGFQLLITSGLSSVPMPMPKDHPDPNPYRYAELVMVLPFDWRFSRIVPNNPELDWPIALLQNMARMPVVSGHSVGIGDVFHDSHLGGILKDVTPFEGCILLPPVTTSGEFNRIFSERGPIHLYSLFPLFKAEMDLIQNDGFLAFKQLLQEGQAQEMMNIHRQSLVPT